MFFNNKFIQFFIFFLKILVRLKFEKRIATLQKNNELCINYTVFDWKNLAKSLT